MKRIIAMLLTVASLLVLASCDKKDIEQGEKEAFDIFKQSDSIMESSSVGEGFLYRSNAEAEEEKLDPDTIHSLYGDIASDPDFGQVEEYAVFIGSSSVNPCEFGIFKMTDNADIETFKLYLKARIDEKLEQAKSYPEIDDEAWTTSVLESKNGYIWYLAIKGENTKLNSEIKEKV